MEPRDVAAVLWALGASGGAGGAADSAELSVACLLQAKHSLEWVRLVLNACLAWAPWVLLATPWLGPRHRKPCMPFEHWHAHPTATRLAEHDHASTI